MNGLHERRALPEGWEECDIMKYVSLVPTGVKPFIGIKKYVETGDLENSKILGYQSVTIENKPSRANQEVQINDVLFAKMKDTEKIFLISKEEENYIFSTGFAIMRISNPKKILPRFLYYWLRTSYFQKKKNKECIGATQKAINITSLKKFKIILPPFNLQSKIVSTLDKAEETKRLRAQADELTERLLQSVFLEMFGDPVKNPKGWEKSRIDAITVHHKQGFYTDSEYTKTGIKLIRITDITEYGSLTYGDMPFLDLDSKTIEQFKVQKGDFLFARSGVSIGRCAIVEKDTLCVFGSYIIRFRFDQNKIDNKFFLFLMKLPRLQSSLKKYAHGSANPNINAENIKNIAIFIPPLPLQQKFARIVEKIESMRRSQNQSKQQVEDLFSALMQKAFRGEI